MRKRELELSCRSIGPFEWHDSTKSISLLGLFNDEVDLGSLITLENKRIGNFNINMKTMSDEFSEELTTCFQKYPFDKIDIVRITLPNKCSQTMCNLLRILIGKAESLVLTMISPIHPDVLQSVYDSIQSREIPVRSFSFQGLFWIAAGVWAFLKEVLLLSDKPIRIFGLDFNDYTLSLDDYPMDLITILKQSSDIESLKFTCGRHYPSVLFESLQNITFLKIVSHSTFHSFQSVILESLQYPSFSPLQNQLY
jgi:hypothetical protein